MPEEVKDPVILAKDLHISDLILRHIHKEVGHGGHNHMLSTLRQKILESWCHCIDQKDTFKMCYLSACKRYPQQMADWPLDRVTPVEPPFTYVGVDYFGPLE